MKRRVLIIDDNATTVKMFVRTLTNFGYECLSENSGLQGISTLKAQEVDFVLLDYLMEEMDGVETMRKIMEEVSDPPPVIMLTANDNMALAIEFMRLGGGNFVVKPVDFNVLDLIINKAINASEKNKKIKEVEKRAIESDLACTLAQKANDAKSKFLAHMSHEFRTPMHQILSFANLSLNLLKKDQINREKLTEFLEEMVDSGKIMESLINDMLDLAKLESGKIKLTLEETNLYELIKNAKHKFETIAAEKNIALNLTAPDFNTTIPLDKKCINQVMQNLLSNSIKFSPKNTGIKIDIQQEENALAVSVSDHGIGIPDHELDQIFDKFQQSSKAYSSQASTGLGLCICKEIIKTHGGQIWAANNIGGGSIFTFTLPTSDLR